MACREAGGTSAKCKKACKKNKTCGHNKKCTCKETCGNKEGCPGSQWGCPGKYCCGPKKRVCLVYQTGQWKGRRKCVVPATKRRTCDSTCAKRYRKHTRNICVGPRWGCGRADGSGAQRVYEEWHHNGRPKCCDSHSKSKPWKPYSTSPYKYCGKNKICK